MKHYKLPNGTYEARKETTKVPSDWIPITVEEIKAEREAAKTPDDIKNELIAKYKGLYLGIVDTKLKSLDYDSLATVKLWEGDATYGAEATQILTWYKNVIATNYGILTAIEASTKYNASWVDVIPTEEEYVAEINAVVF